VAGKAGIEKETVRGKKRWQTDELGPMRGGKVDSEPKTVYKLVKKTSPGEEEDTWGRNGVIVSNSDDLEQIEKR